MMREELRHNYNMAHRISGACFTIILIILNNKVQVIPNGWQGDRLWPLYLILTFKITLDTFLRILQLWSSYWVYVLCKLIFYTWLTTIPSYNIANNCMWSYYSNSSLERQLSAFSSYKHAWVSSFSQGLCIPKTSPTWVLDPCTSSSTSISPHFVNGPNHLGSISNSFSLSLSYALFSQHSSHCPV